VESITVSKELATSSPTLKMEEASSSTNLVTISLLHHVSIQEITMQIFTATKTYEGVSKSF
jgi:hypothetical protein